LRQNGGGKKGDLGSAGPTTELVAKNGASLNGGVGKNLGKISGRIHDEYESGMR